MLIARIDKFQGQAPGIAPQLLPPNVAQSSINVVRENGNLRPLKSPVTVNTPTKAGTKKSIYLFANLYWFHWTEEVDVVKAPIPFDTQERTIFTGVNEPKVTDASIALVGGTDYPMAAYSLGIPAPTVAPVVNYTPPTYISETPKDITAVNWAAGEVTLTSTAHGILDGQTFSAVMQGTGLTLLDKKTLSLSRKTDDALLVKGVTTVANGKITAITKANPAKVTRAGHGLRDGDVLKFSISAGMVELHDYEGAITVVDANNFTLDGKDTTAYTTFTAGTYELKTRATVYAPVNIVSISKTRPTSVAAVDHGLVTGERVSLSVVGMTQLDGWTGQVVKGTAGVFSLRDLEGVMVDSTLYDTFVSGTFTHLCRLEPTAVAVDAQIETTVYVETFLRRWSGIDEEGPPGPPSASVDINFTSGESVALTGLNAAPDTKYNITHRRIYRLNTGSSATDFQLVTELAIAVTEYDDGTLSSTLDEVLTSTEYTAPPTDLKGIRAMPNGSLVGFSMSAKAICFSVPYQPHAWPTRFRLHVDFETVGVEVFGGSVLVTTKGQPYVATGAQPGYMTIDKAEIAQACVSRRGMADMGGVIAYPSPDGLMLIGSGIAKNITEKIYRREDWQALRPSTFLAAAHNGRYYAFYDTGTATGCLSIDMEDGTIDVHNYAATAVHVDLLSDELYAQIGSVIQKWDAGTAQNITWKGPRIDTPTKICPRVAQVNAKTYPCTLKVYADGVLKHTQTVASALPFRLTAGYRADSFEVEVSGTAEVEQVSLAEAMEDLVQ